MSLLWTYVPGDAMVKFTNGALKSAKHRVVPAPGERAGLDRYSVVYFVRPHNDALMKPVSKFENGTHVKVGGKVAAGDDENKVYTAGEWMVKRSIQMGS
jgi:isopenicillin N synthase-like dioxygenase